MQVLAYIVGGLLVLITAVSGLHAVLSNDHLKRQDARRVFNRCLIALGVSQSAIWAIPKLIELGVFQ